MMPLLSQLARIRKRAIECGLKLPELESASGVDSVTILSMCTGRSRPRLDSFVNVAEALGYEVVLRVKPSPQK